MNDGFSVIWFRFSIWGLFTRNRVSVVKCNFQAASARLLSRHVTPTLMFCKNHHLCMRFFFFFSSCMCLSMLCVDPRVWRKGKSIFFGSCKMTQTQSTEPGSAWAVFLHCSITVCSLRLSTHWKAPSCRQLSSHASIDVISGPISLPPIGPSRVTLLSCLTYS